MNIMEALAEIMDVSILGLNEQNEQMETFPQERLVETSLGILGRMEKSMTNGGPLALVEESDDIQEGMYGELKNLARVAGLGAVRPSGSSGYFDSGVNPGKLSARFALTRTGSTQVKWRDTDSNNAVILHVLKTRDGRITTGWDVVSYGRVIKTYGTGSTPKTDSVGRDLAKSIKDLRVQNAPWMRDEEDIDFSSDTQQFIESLMTGMHQPGATLDESEQSDPVLDEAEKGANPWHDNESGQFSSRREIAGKGFKGSASFQFSKRMLPPKTKPGAFKAPKATKQDKKRQLSVGWQKTAGLCGRAARCKGKSIRCSDGKPGAPGGVPTGHRCG